MVQAVETPFQPEFDTAPQPEVRSTHEAHVLQRAAWAYRDIATDGMRYRDAPDELIVIRAVACDEAQRIDALIRSKLVLSYASRNHSSEKFMVSVWSDPAFLSLGTNQSNWEVFRDYIDKAMADIPEYCAKILDRDRKKRVVRKFRLVEVEDQ